MKTSKACILLCSLLFNIQVFASEGTDIRNGGGGLLLNDNTVTTFGETLLKKNRLDTANIPSLSPLKNEIKDLFLPFSLKSELLQKINPLMSRQYYKVDEKSVNANTLHQIKKIYSQLMGLPVGKVTLFALTNPKDQSTLLLPNFYKLNTLQQQAILFHETLWLVKYDITYDTVVSLEKTFQSYISNKTYENCVEFHNMYLKVFEKVEYTTSIHMNCALSDLNKEQMNKASLKQILNTEELNMLVDALTEPYFSRHVTSQKTTSAREDLINSLNTNDWGGLNSISKFRFQLAHFFETMNAYRIEIDYPGINLILNEQNKIDQLKVAIKESYIKLSEKKQNGYYFQLISNDKVILEVPFN